MKGGTMTNYEHGLKRTTDIIGLLILSFVGQAQEQCDKEPCDALNDLTIEIIGQIKAQRRRLEAEIMKGQEQAKRAEEKIRKVDPLRERVLQEVEG